MIPAWGDSEDINLLEKTADSNKRILNNIRNLIAFAQGAKEKAYDMTEGHVKVKIHTSPIVRIVLDLAKKSKMKNIVLPMYMTWNERKPISPWELGTMS